MFLMRFPTPSHHLEYREWEDWLSLVSGFVVTRKKKKVQDHREGIGIQVASQQTSYFFSEWQPQKVYAAESFLI